MRSFSISAYTANGHRRMKASPAVIGEKAAFTIDMWSDFHRADIKRHTLIVTPTDLADAGKRPAHAKALCGQSRTEYSALIYSCTRLLTLKRI